MKFTGYGTTYTLYGNTFVGISWQIIRLRVFDVQVRLWSFRLEQKQKKKSKKSYFSIWTRQLSYFYFFASDRLIDIVMSSPVNESLFMIFFYRG